MQWINVVKYRTEYVSTMEEVHTSTCFTQHAFLCKTEFSSYITN